MSSIPANKPKANSEAEYNGGMGVSCFPAWKPGYIRRLKGTPVRIKGHTLKSAAIGMVWFSCPVHAHARIAAAT